MPTRHVHVLCSTAFILLLVVSAGMFTAPTFAVNFQPVSPDELKMTGEPKAPGAPAIILFREVDRDDRGQTAHEDVYFRIKIFTQEGRKFADIEIPFFKDEGSVVSIRARTIHPDGSIIDFNGKAFDKSIVKARGVRYMAKTFTMPDVQVGSILEYYYRVDLSDRVIVNSHWILSNELFTKSAKFSLNPYTSNYAPISVRWTWNKLPPGSVPAEASNHVINLESKRYSGFSNGRLHAPGK